MKKSLLAVAVLGAFSSAAMAQSSVTIYGVLDTAIRYTTNNDAAGDHKVVLGEGIFQGPRLGFKGNEDLGGGSAAVFDLEAGIVINNGQSDQQGQLFGRQAFVGLKNSSLGEIDFGRQYSLAFQTLGTTTRWAKAMRMKTNGNCSSKASASTIRLSTPAIGVL